MFSSDSRMWMGGMYATELMEITDDVSRLDDGSFWAVSISFEGKAIFARFKKVITAQFPIAPWVPLSQKWKSSMSSSEYMEYVRRVQAEIARGGVYQVNACRILEHPMEKDRSSLAGLFSQLLKANPARYATYLKVGEVEIASASPELFLSRNGLAVLTSPIKGTMPISEAEFGEKDKAENLMIVDLMRNDLGRISQTGTVEVGELFRRERHPGILHLVSDVTGKLKKSITWREILAATIPPGSVSGAPKSTAIKIIERNEGERGPYCGALGWVHGDQAQLSVAIRTFWTTGDLVLKFGTGAGITWGSDPESEWEETELKARHLISIAGGVI